MTSESSGVGFESAPLLSFSLAQGGGKVFFRFSSMRSFSRLRRQLLTLASPFCLLRHCHTGAEDAAGRKIERFLERSPRLRK